MRYARLCTLIRTALIAGALAAGLVGPVEAGQLDRATAGNANPATHAEALLGGVVPVTSPQGHSNLDSSGPRQGPGPGRDGGPNSDPNRGPERGPSSGPDRGPAFGTPNIVFTAGSWSIIRSQGEFYLWTGNGDTAIQITLDSNGWWGLRRGWDERIVWSSGKTKADPFYDRPWQRPPSTSYPISSTAYQGPSRWGTTFLDIGNDQIRITLTDRGVIQIDARSSRIVFTTSRGVRVDF